MFALDLSEGPGHLLAVGIRVVLIIVVALVVRWLIDR